MPTELVPRTFDQSHLLLVSAINCGPGQFGIIATEWIKCIDSDDCALLVCLTHLNPQTLTESINTNSILMERFGSQSILPPTPLTESMRWIEEKQNREPNRSIRYSI